MRADQPLEWLHDCSTEDRPTPNGMIERQNGDVLEGARSVLFHSVVEHKS